jgi:hypothetical protein
MDAKQNPTNSAALELANPVRLTFIFKVKSSNFQCQPNNQQIRLRIQLNRRMGARSRGIGERRRSTHFVNLKSLSSRLAQRIFGYSRSPRSLLLFGFHSRIPDHSLEVFVSFHPFVTGI